MRFEQPLNESLNESPHESLPMRPLRLTPDLAQADLSDIRLVATDMDGTLTSAGQFTPALLQAFARLHEQGIEVMIVTGRSAGWVSGLVNYLPVVGAIAENGGLYIGKQTPEPVILSDIPRMSGHRDRLATLFDKLKLRCPNLRPSADNPFRITDWTFEIEGLTEADLAWMQTVCEENTMGFTYSNVQCHLKTKRQNKADGLVKVLQQQFSHIGSTAVVTVGDSPNDESLFDPSQFPCSVGVANVAHYLPVLAHQPAYITALNEGAGFVELVDRLVAAQK
jgi:hydroxymethylpyrimidine pyrophosphatase-like HAD family hydrolase